MAGGAAIAMAATVLLQQNVEITTEPSEAAIIAAPARRQNLRFPQPTPQPMPTPRTTPLRPRPSTTPSRPRSTAPTVGVVTSGYGMRWGVEHYGLDIANDIGTPVVSVTDGLVIDAGQATGFGLWVRVRHDDGTIAVYGHINETLVAVGQRVIAGQEVATVGNRGNSTGPHLHFEVRQPDGSRLDTAGWLQARGIEVGN
ncbi:MAG: M23 family metallopeptidase [Gordonia polyisoprenivorans]|nr:M23 family metallopeptidase [Gordonia polyisoprenivorans]